MSDTDNQKKGAGRHRFLEAMDAALEKRPVQYGLVAVAVMVVSLLVGPSLLSSESARDKLQLGKPSPLTVKATHEFPYQPSQKTLEKRRAAAAKKVLPVFDNHTDRFSLLVWRINLAFERMTRALRGPVKDRPGAGRGSGRAKAGSGSGRTRNAKAGGGSGSGAGAGSARASAGAAAGTSKGPAMPASPKQKKATIAELRELFAKTLGVPVSKKLFKQFHKNRFSPDLLAACLALINFAVEQMIVPTRASLKPFEGRPIVVRYLVAGRVSARGQKRLQDFSTIQDVAQLGARIADKANIHASKLRRPLRKALVSLVQSMVRGNANLTYNKEESDRRKQAARAKIVAQTRRFLKRQVIVRDGTPVTAEHLRIIEKMEGHGRRVSRAHLTLLGIAFLAALLLVVVHRFAGHHFRKLTLRPRDLAVMGLLAVVLLAITRGVIALLGDTSSAGIYPYVLPVAAGAMLVRMIIGPEAAALFAVVLSVLAGLALERSGALGLAIYYFVTGLVGASGMAKVQSRSSMLRAGLYAGGVGSALAFGLALTSGEVGVTQLLFPVFAGFGGGLISAFTVLALLPALEWLFGYTTDVTLLELANLNHPLLRDLMLQAPGTYHHSMVVGNLSEAACEAIGANSLLAHVACNYHDVGKIKNANYFAENLKGGENPHNRLKPSMSALIIRSHVKDGIELLREHNIPDLVISTAMQHHGTQLIEFFHQKAIQQADGDEEVREEDYRYPGPKPQSREAGVIMLADGVEAAARSLPEPTEDRLRELVQRMINAKFAGGQLDQCDLTLRDLHLIARSFLQVLRGIYHQRPTYPWQRDKSKGEGKASRPDKTLKGIKSDKTPKGEKADERPDGGAPRRQCDSRNLPRQQRRQRADATPSGANTGEQQAKAGPPASGDDDERAAADDGVVAAASTEPAGAGSEGAKPAGPASAPEAAADSPSDAPPDIKRLGLN